MFTEDLREVALDERLSQQAQSQWMVFRNQQCQHHEQIGNAAYQKSQKCFHDISETYLAETNRSHSIFTPFQFPDLTINGATFSEENTSVFIF